MTTPRRDHAFRARATLTGGTDFDRIAEWATAHLTTLVHEIVPGWGKGRGGRLRGPCFLHGGSNPNLDVHNGRGWHCHSGCGTGGDGVDLWRRVHFAALDEKAGRLAALRDLAPRAGVVLDTRPGDRPVVRAAPRVLRPPRQPAPRGDVLLPADVAAALAQLRAEGHVPTPAPTLYASVLAALPRTAAGDAVLAARGFDPAAAYAAGFRTVDDAEGWATLERVLLAEALPAECMAAGFRYEPKDATQPTRLRVCPWWPPVPALMLPYWHRGAVVALRFRATTAETPKAGRYRSLAGADVVAPFGADALDDCANQVVHVVEGELNAYTLHTYGRRAIGLPGAAAWRPEWTPPLRAARAVVAWFDEDAAGTKGRTRLADALRDAFGPLWLAQRAVTRPLPPQRDVNDLHRAGLLARYLETVPA